MSQETVYHFLSKHKGRWFKPKDIAVCLGRNPNCVRSNINRMRFFHGVERRVIIGRAYEVRVNGKKEKCWDGIDEGMAGHDG